MHFLIAPLTRRHVAASFSPRSIPETTTLKASHQTFATLFPTPEITRVGRESSRNSCKTFGRLAGAIIVTSHLKAPMAGTDYYGDWFGIVGGMLCLRIIGDSIAFSLSFSSAVYLI